MSRRFNGVDSRVLFCKSVTGDLRHFSADERDDLSRRLPAWTAADGFARARPETCGIFRRADGFVAEIQRSGLAASGFTRARPATCAIFGGREGGFTAEIQRRGRPRTVLQECDRRLALFFSGRMRGFVAEIQQRRLAASGFAEAQPASRGTFQRTDERGFVAEIQRGGQPRPVLQKRDRRLAAFSAGGWICRGDSTAWTSCVLFCRSATNDLRHLSADG